MYDFDQVLGPFFFLFCWRGKRHVCLCGFYSDEDLDYNPYICVGDPNSVKKFHLIVWFQYVKKKILMD